MNVPVKRRHWVENKEKIHWGGWMLDGRARTQKAEERAGAVRPEWHGR